MVSIKIIDLEIDHRAIGLKCSEIVFLVRVVRVGKVVEHGDGFDDPMYRPCL